MEPRVQDIFAPSFSICKLSHPPAHGIYTLFSMLLYSTENTMSVIWNFLTDCHPSHIVQPAQFYYMWFIPAFTNQEIINNFYIIKNKDDHIHVWTENIAIDTIQFILYNIISWLWLSVYNCVQPICCIMVNFKSNKTRRYFTLPTVSSS